MEERIRVIIELPLNKEQLIQLGKQKKQIRIVAEDLKTIEANHQKRVVQCGKRLKLKEAAAKVV